VLYQFYSLFSGCERYSTYSGYSSSFTWTGDYADKTPYDLSRRRKCHIVAIDAKEFHKPQSQYTINNLERELNKAYVGFYHPLNGPAPGGTFFSL
jgi:poly(ADP-ribose) glycohydrolase